MKKVFSERQKVEFIGERKLIKGDVDNKVIVVKVGIPQRIRKGEWVCQFHIIGKEEPIAQQAYGIDAIQSLIMALEGIRVALEKGEDEYRWEGGETGDTGFPRYVPTFFGLNFSRRINKVIDKEISLFSEKAKKKSLNKE